VFTSLVCWLEPKNKMFKFRGWICCRSLQSFILWFGIFCKLKDEMFSICYQVTT